MCISMYADMCMNDLPSCSQCMDTCVGMNKSMCTDMCRDIHIDMVCADMCIDIHIHMACADMCTGVSIDIHASINANHVCRRAQSSRLDGQQDETAHCPASMRA